MRNRGWAAAGTAAGLSGLVLLVAACGSSGTSTNAGSAYGGSSRAATPSSSAMSGGTTSGTGAKTATLTIRATKIGQVLTDAQGDTLYWYSKDTKDSPSTCTGSCLKEWPMVTGKAVAAPGVKLAGVLGEITGAGGTIQASYNGYPLYTYAGDMTPGDTTGNNAGGVWHVITGSVLTTAAGQSAGSGGMAATPTKSASSGGYGGGSGYGEGEPAGSGASSGSGGSAGSSGSGASAGSAGHQNTGASTAPAPAAAPSTAAPAPAPSDSASGAGCGEGACW